MCEGEIIGVSLTSVMERVGKNNIKHNMFRTRILNLFSGLVCQSVAFY